MTVPLKIAELFARDVTRDIPPVVYFHEQSPKKLADEVSEYIITGGYPEQDPRHVRVPVGIHEQYVRLLEHLVRELDKKGGPELPAAWISGFYGSGKSSFAKLLGLALDGRELPDGRPLAKALLDRDDSPNRAQLHRAWDALRQKVDAMAVVFDVGSEANDGEQIHSVIARVVQRRLGYSSFPSVADAELRLERDGEYEHFLEAAHRTLGRDWSEARDLREVEIHFSHIRHAMNPGAFVDPLSWYDSFGGSRRSAGLSSSETVKNLEAMLTLRAPGKTLFVVVDEVSQYIHRNDDRMLRLQSFVSDLGQRLRGKAWLLATGQQKLEDGDTIGKLKDRFPPSLRVHLATTNIRDVVHRRLLKKNRDREPALRDLFQLHGSQLKLYGFDCEKITEEDFVDVYPMLPGHVDLLMELTSALRQRSQRTQGDDYAIRGLLQLLGELFREQKLADQPVGTLLTLDAIYDVQQTAFDSSLQMAMKRIFTALEKEDVRPDAWECRVAKAISLLQLINDQQAVTAERIASCLYRRLGDPNPLSEVKPALEKLSRLNLIGYSEKEGYKIQSSEGQQWQREREDVHVSLDEVNRLVRDKLAELMRDPERPRLKGQPFYWVALLSDGRQLRDDRILSAGDDASITLDFRLHDGRQDPSSAHWMKLSKESQLEDRILWVAGNADYVAALRDLGQSRAMLRKYESRRSSLASEKLHLLIDEQVRSEELERTARAAVEQAFMEGELFFRGQKDGARTYGTTFGTIMSQVGTVRLPQLYTQHTEVRFTDKELDQLLSPSLSGVSAKFLAEGLGLLTQDGGKFIATCQGPVPTAVLASIERHDGAAGNVLLQEFARPPYGFPSDVVRACLLALLRAKKVKVKLEDGAVLTSPMDAGARELFLQVTRLKRSNLFPNKDETVTQRDRIAMTKFLAGLGRDVEPEDESIAEAVFETFSPLREKLRTLELRYSQLPGRPMVEEPLRRLGDALESCRRARDIDPTVKALKEALPALSEGTRLLLQQLTDLSEDMVTRVRAAADVRDHLVKQLVQDGSQTPVVAEIKEVEAQLNARRPWQDLSSIDGALERIREHYKTRRAELLAEQETRAEEVRAAFRLRPGFEKLTEEEAHQVFRPIGQALAETTPDATHPTLYVLKMDFLQKLERAADEAETTFDALLAAKDQQPVVKVELNLRGREVATPGELDRVLGEIRDRVSEQLARGHKVRLG